VDKINPGKKVTTVLRTP